MDRSRVNPEDSTEAVRQLRLVDAYIQQASWGEALDLLQTMIETYPIEVIPIPHAQPARYISVRTHCHQLISTFPPEALTPYRERVNGQAEALLSEFEKSGNEEFCIASWISIFAVRPLTRRSRNSETANWPRAICDTGWHGGRKYFHRIRRPMTSLPLFTIPIRKMTCLDSGSSGASVNFFEEN